MLSIIRLIVPLVILLSLAIMSPVIWADKDNKGDIAGVCKADIVKFCPKVTKGQGRIYTCLSIRASDLRPDCKTTVGAKKAAIDKSLAACGRDVATFCKDVKKGEGRIVVCLKAAKYKISVNCKARIESKDEFIPGVEELD